MLFSSMNESDEKQQSFAFTVILLVCLSAGEQATECRKHTRGGIPSKRLWLIALKLQDITGLVPVS